MANHKDPKDRTNICIRFHVTQDMKEKIDEEAMEFERNVSQFLRAAVNFWINKRGIKQSKEE